MKEIMLTGFGNERAFGDVEPTFYLVFNGGELRVPVTQQAAELVAEYVYGQPQTPVAQEQQPPAPADGVYEDRSDEDGAGAEDGVPSL